MVKGQIEIKLTKEEIDKLEEAIENLKEWGYSHVEVGEEYLIFHCKELVKNREDYEKDLKKIEKGEIE